MRVLLAGASGAIGSYLVPMLHDRGHSVLGVTRSNDGAARVRMLGAEALVVDLLRQKSVDEALTGYSADAIIHEATGLDRTPMRHRDLRATNALRIDGTKNLLRVAPALGVRRFVTQSFFLGYGYYDHGRAMVDETHPFGVARGDAFDEHLRAMRVNEEQVLDADEVEGIALRYGLFYGNDRSTRQMRVQLLKRRLPIPTPSAVTSLIHLQDAASCTVAALEHGRPGHAYNVADDHPLPLADFIGTLAEVTEAPRPTTIPPWLLRPWPYAYAFMARSTIRMSAAKAKNELEWTPHYPTIHEGLEATTKSWSER